MRHLFAIAMLVSISTLAGAQDDSDVSAAEDATLAWLSLTDSGRYADSWRQAASFFRAAITIEDWVTALEGARATYGAVHAREVASAEYATALPGAPDGEYVVFVLNASFENKENAIETVTAMKDLDGAWRVGGYFVR